MSDIETISLHSEADRNSLKGFIQESVNCKQKMAIEAEAITDIRNEAKDRLGIPPKIFNRLVRAAFKDAFEDEKRADEEFETIVDILKL